MTRLLFFWVCIGIINAHPFWLLPSRFDPDAKELVNVTIFIGDVLAPEEYARNPFHIKKFNVYGQDFKSVIFGIDGKSPAGYLRLPKNDQYTIVYESYPSAVFLPMESFKKYIEEEDLKVDNLPQKDSIQEYYTRFAKCLLYSKSDNSDFESSIVGLPLEIVCKTNPNSHDNNQEFSFQILYQQKPLPQQTIKATCIEDGNTQKQISDEKGIVHFVLSEGPWLISTVLIEEHADDESIDFESYWSSLTFYIGSSKQEHD